MFYKGNRGQIPMQYEQFGQLRFGMNAGLQRWPIPNTAIVVPSGARVFLNHFRSGKRSLLS
jgi:hypothetical protein